jgi:hypothetical protein
LWTLALTAGDAAWMVVFVGTPVLVIAHYGGQPELAGLILGGFGGGAVWATSSPTGSSRQAPLRRSSQAA